VLPKELKPKAMKRCIEGNTFDMVKKTEADKSARKVEIAREFKGDVRITFKQIKLSVRITSIV